MIVIDRHFFGTGSYKNIVILEPLRDLQVDAVRIVWTAYPEEKDIIASMGLDAWDYLNKKKPRYGNTCTDVIVSAIRGLKWKESELRRAEINRDGSEFVTKHYGEIHSKHKGNFIALEKAAGGDWRIEPVGTDPSLFGLYDKLGGRKREDIYVVFIGE